MRGFSLNELNDHFAAVSCSSTESIDEATTIINSAPDEGFAFKHVSLNDVILAVAHFTSQAKGEDGIPQSVIAKGLPTLGPLLVHLFNTSLDYGVFPGAWKKAQLIPLKKKVSTYIAVLVARSWRSWFMSNYLNTFLEKGSLIHFKLASENIIVLLQHYSN